MCCGSFFLLGFVFSFGLISVTIINSMMMQPPTTSPYAPPPAAQDPRQALPPNFVPHFNGINPNYPGVRAISFDPPLFCVDNFLTPQECQFLIHAASDSFSPAPVVGKGAGEISPSRTSSTCYLAKEDLPDLLRKVSALTGKPIEHCELPQVGRYLSTQQYFQVRAILYNIQYTNVNQPVLHGRKTRIPKPIYPSIHMSLYPFSFKNVSLHSFTHSHVLYFFSFCLCLCVFLCSVWLPFLVFFFFVAF